MLITQYTKLKNKRDRKKKEKKKKKKKKKKKEKEKLNDLMKYSKELMRCKARICIYTLFFIVHSISDTGDSSFSPTSSFFY